MAFELVDRFRDLCEQRKTLSKELVVADDRGVSYSGFLLLDRMIHLASFATELYRRGVSLKSAQYLLGHSTPDITARIYVDCDDSTANAEMLEKLMYDVSEDLEIPVEELLD